MAKRPRRRDQQRMAVGLRLGGGIRPDIAAGAGLVLDDDRLAPFRLQLVAGNARDHVNAAAALKRDDEFDRFRGKLRLGGGRRRERRQGA
jgi:hypothetical protein